MAELRTRTPEIPLALLLWLEELFPPLTPKINWQDRKIWIEVGKCQAVEKLRLEYEHQQQEALQDVHIHEVAHNATPASSSPNGPSADG